MIDWRSEPLGHSQCHNGKLNRFAPFPPPASLSSSLVFNYLGGVTPIVLGQLYALLGTQHAT